MKQSIGNRLSEEKITQIIAKEIGITKPLTRAVILTFLDLIKETLAQGNNISFQGFGIFDLRNRQAVNKHRIKRGDKKKSSVIRIEARYIPRFKPAIGFKQRVKANINPLTKK